MRNISLSDFESKRLHIDDCEAFVHDHKTLYAISKGLVLKSKKDNEEVICNLTQSLYPENDINEVPRALRITYSCEKDVLYIFLVNGDIVCINLEENGTESIVGSVDGGIKCIQWSPEQEVLAIVTGFYKVIVMTNEFDLISEVDLHGEGFGEKQFITVGWGKKETQFRGSEGKINAGKKEETEIEVESNENVEISWRGDAEYFVVSSLNPHTCKRYLRIFNKSGILQFTSENFIGLESCLDWRPSGDLISSAQRLPNKYCVCFFEKNGLKHGEFELPFSYRKFKVQKVLWNKDSKILAILVSKISEHNLKDFKNLQSGNWTILFYTIGNYHWYLKYTLDFDMELTPFLIDWDSQFYNTLHVVLKKDKIVYHYKYSWLWVTNKTRCGSLKNDSLVAVIDGSDLLITSFKRGIVPPPMCSYKINFPLPINGVSFGPNDDSLSSNDIIVHLCDNSLYLYKLVAKELDPLKYDFIGKANPLSNELEVNYNIHWVSSSKLMLCNVKVTDNKSIPYLNVLDINEVSHPFFVSKQEILLKSTISLSRSWKSVIIIHTNDGKLYKVDIKNNKVFEHWENNEKKLLDFEIGFKENNTFYVFSLDNLNKFYIDDKILFDNILSFHIHENFVILTSLKHQLICFDFQNQIPNNRELSQIYFRKVERGSRVVTSVHKDIKVILQMPRGNLECIQPRILSLFILKKYLNSLNYYEAFDLMRKQRINLNLIYDHNPTLFTKNINIFIEQIKDPLWINLFISELCEEDVTETMYSGIYMQTTNAKETTNIGSKINNVIEMIEKVLLNKHNAEAYLLPIFTCYVKRGSDKYLETALLKLKDLKEKEHKGIKLIVSFDEAFKYLLYLIDVDELYKVALGLYDFDLALMIVNKSQKDPKEYIPFLNNLRNLDINYQKFMIDKYLKRYEKALMNLVQCDGDDFFNECLGFIKAHKLYKLGLKLIPKNTDRYKNLCMCYGEELMKSNLYEEAALMYINAGIYKNAVEAYKKSGNWQEVIYCAKEMKLKQPELNEMYLDLAVELSERKCYKEAATIYLDYLQNVVECVKTLSNGKLFSEAYRIIDLHNRYDLIDTLMIPAILDQSNFLNFQIGNYIDTFITQKSRLQVVRKQKLEAIQNKDYLDVNSETSSVCTDSYKSSQLSSKTYRSAKNRRKQERKLFSLKEGSPYEDLALITSLHNIVTNCECLKLEIKEVNKFLVKLRNYELAEKLQNNLEELLKIIETSKSEIWISDLQFSKQNFGPEATSNGISAMYVKYENSLPTFFNPKFAIPPESQTNVKWKLEFLNP